MNKQQKLNSAINRLTKEVEGRINKTVEVKPAIWTYETLRVNLVPTRTGFHISFDSREQSLEHSVLIVSALYLLVYLCRTGILSDYKEWDLDTLTYLVGAIQDPINIAASQELFREEVDRDILGFYDGVAEMPEEALPGLENITYIPHIGGNEWFGRV